MTTDSRTIRPPIAVVGVSALFPGSVDATGFWTDILAGTDRITEVPPTHWLIDDHYAADPSAPDKTYGRRGGFLDPIDFDAMGFGVPPSVVPSTDTAQLLALIVAQHVLDDALRGQFTELDRTRASVILGVTSGQELLGAMASRMNRPMWLQGMRRAGIAEDVAQDACDRILALHPEWTESTFPGLLGNVVAGRIANRLDLGGTNCVTDAACASSFSAISMGVNELYLGDSDLVIAGGVDTMNDIFMYMCFSKTPALSRSEDIRPFSSEADGTMLGEGIGMVALKRLDDAERDGNDIYCVVNGVGASSDGRSKSVYAPVSSGQARAIRNAYAKTSYGPETVELVEAHGTGTVAGDAAEFAGLELAFDAADRTDRQWCALGSVKSQIGHTKAAAGAAGLFKIVMALHHKVLPQTAKIETPNPELRLEHSPFHLNTRTRPWVRNSDHGRRGSVSSFGFGGSNFHIALSEYDGDAARAPRLRTADSELVILCGVDGADIVEQARHHIDAATLDGYLRFVAQTSQRAFAADAPTRLAVTAGDEADLRDKLGQAIERITSDQASPFSMPTGVHYGTSPRAGDLAFVFPGQGSQYLFMGADLAMTFSDAMVAWDRVADQDWDGKPLHDVVFPITAFDDGADDANEALLTATHWAQPAIGTTSIGLLRVLRAIGLDAQHTAGHSFGEITALHAAGILSEVDMIRVARQRGQLMAEAAQTPGSMTAVSGTIEAVRTIVEQSGSDVVIANHNAPHQVVLSGPTEAIEQVELELRAAGVAARRLPVATAFHSAVVSGASERFAEFLDDVAFRAPLLPVHSNETARPYPGDDPTAMRAQLARQLARPVRFVESIEAIYDGGVRTFVEVGPSSVLTGLIGNILDGRDHLAVPLDKRNRGGLFAFFDGLGRLAAAGVEMDLAALWREYGDVSDPHDLQKPKLAIALGGANYGRPYPPCDLTELAGPNPTASAPIDAASAPTAPAAPPQPAKPAEPVAAGRPTAPAVSPMTPDAKVLAAHQNAQQQTADAHIAYLNSLAQAHTAFLDAAQQGIAILGQLAGATPVDEPSNGPTHPTPPPASAVRFVAPAPVVRAAEPVGGLPAATEHPPHAAAEPEVPVPVAVVADPLPGGGSVVEMMPLLLGVVSDRTGYPVEMLSMEMELESDLGIDSIKRVEILSAMQDLVPDLPDVDLEAMAALATLGEIVEYLDSRVAGDPPLTPTSEPLPDAAAHPVPVAVVADPLPGGGSVVEMMPLLLGVVSDRTGYPVEMLSMEMELESDLGIDSIKRVEILSAMQDLVPDLPDVDLEAMAALATLGEIVEYLSRRGETPAAPGDTTEAGEALPGAFGRFVVRTRPSATTGEPSPWLFDGKVVVTDDEGGVAELLAAALVEHAVDAVVGSIGDAPGQRSVVYLGNLRATPDVERALALNRDAFAAAKAYADSAVEGGAFVAVDDQQGTFGYAGSDATRMWTSGLGALCRTAALEWPAATVRTIDIDRAGRSADAVARAIATEVLEGGSSPQVGLAADGARTILETVPVAVQAGTLPIGSSDVIVVSGGGRGVTAAAIVELARPSSATFVLLGRSHLDDEPEWYRPAVDDAALKQIVLDRATAAGRTMTPAELDQVAGGILAAREIRGTIASIERVGGHAHYLPVDVGDLDAVDHVLDRVRAEIGPITGVVHGAGVLADKLIADKSPAQFDRVFGPKVIGLRNLLSATTGDRLNVLCLFSSVAALTGNVGQADYAMANEILNKVAISERTRRGDECVVKSLGWGPWAGGMVTPALRRHFESNGVDLIELEVGARMFVDELASPQTDQVEVVLGCEVLARPVAVASAQRVSA